MRVTNGMLVQNMLRNINLNMNRLAKLQQQAASEKTVQYASDNPVLATRILKLRNYVSDVEQLKKNADDAKSWMDFCDSAMDQMDENMQRVRELMVNAANGTNSEDEKTAIKAEIEELKRAILETGNSSYAGRYVFAGYDSNTAPLEDGSTAVGNKVLYRGKYMSIGGPVSASVSDDDYKAFYLANMDKISGQPELLSANFTAFTAESSDAALDPSFTVTLDGVETTITLTEGASYGMNADMSDPNNILAVLQDQLDAAFPPAGDLDHSIKVSSEDGKIKLTVQDGSSLRIGSGTLSVRNLGFTDGAESTENEKDEIQYQVNARNRVAINVEGSELFGQGQESLFSTLTKLELALDGETQYKTATCTNGTVTVETHDLDISSLLGDFDKAYNQVLKVRADLGARSNYVNLTLNRLNDNTTIYTELLSKNEDVDLAEVAMKLSNAQTVYSAALSTGAKVIQPTLLDFLS